MRQMMTFVGCLVVVAGSAWAEQPPCLDGVKAAMEKAIAEREIAGAVTMVADGKKLLHLSVDGLADLDSQRPMKADTPMWIASMTKPVTGTAIMMLHEQGKLAITDPVAKYIPEFANLKAADGKPVTVTITHLLTHTSGLAEITPVQAANCRTLADVIPLYTQQPVKFEPGSKWVYCQSSINTAGRIVEVVSGKPFQEFLAERLFAPLGMVDTAFYLTDDQAKRVATTYRREATGDLVPGTNPVLYGKSPTSTDRFPAANGGLYSTANDYLKFCQMVLNKGEFAGNRLLKVETVELMTQVHTGDLVTGFTPGNGWGIGWCVVRKPQAVTGHLSPGTFGHGGAHGTQAWIDPVKQRIYLLMVQRANFSNSDASDVKAAFLAAAQAP